MRKGALALVLLATACGQTGGDGNEAGGAGNAAAPADFAGEARNTAATLALAASGPGGCSASWDGQAASPQQVLERSSSLIERAIQQQGSVANLTEETLPAVAVTAPDGLGFGCADTYLAAIRRAGVPTVLLSPEGGAPALVDFTLSDIGAPPASVVIAIGAGGRLTWNNEAVTLAALPERLRQMSGDGPGAEMVTARGELELRPAREATFGQVHQVLGAVRAGHVRAALLLPSVEPSRPTARPSAPVPPPPAAANQATPPVAANETAPRP